MLRFTLCCLLVFSAPTYGVLPIPVTPLIKKIQSAWKTTKSFESEFTQTVTSKTLGIPDESKGKLYVKKPNKFRWEASEGGSIQIINHKTLIQIQPKARNNKDVVDIWVDAKGRIDTRFLDMVAGTVPIETYYKSKLLSQKGENYSLQFTPQEGKGTVYIAKIAKNGYLLTALEFETEESRTEISFFNTKKNTSMPDSLFTYNEKSGSKAIVNRHK